MDMFGGGGETTAQKRAGLVQQEEIKRLKKIEAQKVSAASRKRSGRASLISGSETGLKDTLG